MGMTDTFMSSFTTEAQPSIVPDDALLPLIATRDERAFRQLVERHGPRAYAVALAILKVPADAEEVLDDAFAQVWQNAARYSVQRGSVAVWIATITRTRALDRLRGCQRNRAFMELIRANPEEALDEFTPRGRLTPDELVEIEELRVQVNVAIANLSALQREVVHLAFFRGLSQTEIATALGAPLGTVKARALAAMVKLRSSLASVRQSQIR